MKKSTNKYIKRKKKITHFIPDLDKGAWGGGRITVNYKNVVHLCVRTQQCILLCIMKFGGPPNGVCGGGGGS